MEKQYFLFGEEICRIYLEYGISKALEAAERCIFQIYCWDENSTPLNLLEEFVGWNDFTDLTEEEYNQFLKLQEG